MEDEGKENIKSNVDLSNIPLKSNMATDGVLTHYWYLQINGPNIRLDHIDSCKIGILAMKKVPNYSKKDKSLHEQTRIIQQILLVGPN